MVKHLNTHNLIQTVFFLCTAFFLVGTINAQTTEEQKTQCKNQGYLWCVGSDGGSGWCSSTQQVTNKCPKFTESECLAQGSKWCKNKDGITGWCSIVPNYQCIAWTQSDCEAQGKSWCKNRDGSGWCPDAPKSEYTCPAYTEADCVAQSGSVWCPYNASGAASTSPGNCVQGPNATCAAYSQSACTAANYIWCNNQNGTGWCSYEYKSKNECPMYNATDCSAAGKIWCSMSADLSGGWCTDTCLSPPFFSNKPAQTPVPAPTVTPTSTTPQTTTTTQAQAPGAGAPLPPNNDATVWAHVNVSTGQITGSSICTKSVCGLNGEWHGYLPPPTYASGSVWWPTSTRLIWQLPGSAGYGSGTFNFQTYVFTVSGGTIYNGIFTPTASPPVTSPPQTVTTTSTTTVPVSLTQKTATTTQKAETQFFYTCLNGVTVAKAEQCLTFFPQQTESAPTAPLRQPELTRGPLITFPTTEPSFTPTSTQMMQLDRLPRVLKIIDGKMRAARTLIKEAQTTTKRLKINVTEQLEAIQTTYDGMSAAYTTMRNGSFDGDDLFTYVNDQILKPFAVIQQDAGAIKSLASLPKYIKTVTADHKRYAARLKKLQREDEYELADDAESVLTQLKEAADDLRVLARTRITTTSAPDILAVMQEIAYLRLSADELLGFLTIDPVEERVRSVLLFTDFPL